MPASLSQRVIRAAVKAAVTETHCEAPYDLNRIVKIVAAKAWPVFRDGLKPESVAQRTYLKFFSTHSATRTWVEREIYRKVTQPHSAGGKRVKVFDSRGSELSTESDCDSDVATAGSACDGELRRRPKRRRCHARRTARATSVDSCSTVAVSHVDADTDMTQTQASDIEQDADGADAQAYASALRADTLMFADSDINTAQAASRDLLMCNSHDARMPCLPSLEPPEGATDFSFLFYAKRT